ncbi:hypothetical protein HDV01_004368 [Terramyces sp. JEL0728]|nr:hypothetical protein HDV01_004368 [Terramyces sp. JEL0728]
MDQKNENKAIWIRYGNNRPVKLRTHYHPDGTARGLPLLDVADLIRAFFPNSPPNELGQYTLHTGNLENDALEEDFLLSSLNSGHTRNTALIINTINPNTVEGLVSGLEQLELLTTYNLKEPDSEEVKTYTDLAEKLEKTKNENGLESLGNKIEGNGSHTGLPFFVMVGSSGVGKTQMAFNLKAMGFHVVYIPLLFKPNSLIPDDAVQSIYSAFSQFTEAFKNCINKDWSLISRLNDQSSYPDKLYCYGFLAAILKNEQKWKPIQKSKSELEKTISSFLQKKKKKKNGKTVKKKVLVFLDEFPAHERHAANEDELRFIRNVYRNVGITVIIASTNSAATNLLKGNNSSSRPGVWCHVIPTCCPYVVPEDAVILPWLKLLLEHSRPLFAQAAYQYWKKDQNPGKSVTIPYLTNMFSDIFTQMKRQWKQYTLSAFTHGQVCLLLSAHSIEENRNEVQSDMNTTKSDGGLIIEKHYSNLEEQEIFSLTLTEKKKLQLMEPSRTRNKSDLWTPTTTFRPPAKDLLLHLVSMGWGVERPFKEYFASAYNDTKKHQSFKLPIENPNQKTESGLELEALVCGAIVLASRLNGLESSEWLLFLKRFVLELVIDFSDTNPSTANNIDDKVKRILSGKTIPFLGFPDVEWPESLESLLGFNVGTVKRCANSEMFDINVEREVTVNCIKQSQKVFTVEVKDRIAKFGWTLVKETFSRVPAGSEIHIIVMNDLKHEYKEDRVRELKPRAGKAVLK